MVAIPTTKYWQSQETATATTMNAGFRDNFNFLGCGTAGGGKPTVSGYLTGASPAITHGTWFRMDWTGELWNTDSMHSNSVNPYRFTATTAGIYECQFRVKYSVNLSAFGNDRAMTSMFAINNNGSSATRAANTLFEEGRYADGTSCRDLAEPMCFTICDYFTLLAGDYIECWTRYDGPSAGSANLQVNQYGCFASMKWVQ